MAEKKITIEITESQASEIREWIHDLMNLISIEAKFYERLKDLDKRISDELIYDDLNNVKMFVNPKTTKELIFKDRFGIYELKHYNGGTAIRVIMMIPSKYANVLNIDVKLYKQVKKTLNDPKNNMGDWWSLEYTH